MFIIDLPGDNQQVLSQVAVLLVAGFREHWPNAWPTLDAAWEEVTMSFGPDRINRIAVDAVGEVLGWVGATSQYHGSAWELHPLIVHPNHQGRGVGRALVVDLETHVKARGGVTIYLGTDDEDGMTTLSNVDLYPHVAEHIARVQNLRRHPYEFYMKLGYTIVGVIPDANGLGKPDILMAKRLRGWTREPGFDASHPAGAIG